MTFLVSCSLIRIPPAKFHFGRCEVKICVFLQALTSQAVLNRSDLTFPSLSIKSVINVSTSSSFFLLWQVETGSKATPFYPLVLYFMHFYFSILIYLFKPLLLSPTVRCNHIAGLLSVNSYCYNFNSCQLQNSKHMHRLTLRPYSGAAFANSQDTVCTVAFVSYLSLCI